MASDDGCASTTDLSKRRRVIRRAMYRFSYPVTRAGLTPPYFDFKNGSCVKAAKFRGHQAFDLQLMNKVNGSAYATRRRGKVLATFNESSCVRLWLGLAAGKDRSGNYLLAREDWRWAQFWRLY